MLYFKNSELADTYHVSVRTVRNWIKMAKEGKLDLTLHADAGHVYVSNTTGNIARIEELVKKGKKFRPHHTIKSVTPKPEFYNLYTPAQIYDIVTNLDIHREVPRQYNYFDGGASYWDRYTQRLSEESSPNLLTSTIRLLEINASYIDNLLEKYKRVNIVDIGVGNALPVKAFISRLIEKKKLGRYIAIDISPEMLHIAEKNMAKWFGKKVDFEGYEFDINYERLRTILAEESLSKNAKETVNVALFLGGTLENLQEPDGALRAIHDSLGRKDLFIQSLKLDAENSRRFFDFNSQPQATTSLAPNHRFIFDLLNIDEEFYTVEMGYDSDLNARYIRVRLKVALTIHFEFDESGECDIDFNKDDTILLWRYWHQTGLEVLEQLSRNKFHTLQASETADQEYQMTISQVKRD